MKKILFLFKSFHTIHKYYKTGKRIIKIYKMCGGREEELLAFLSKKPIIWRQVIKENIEKYYLKLPLKLVKK